MDKNQGQVGPRKYERKDPLIGVGAFPAYVQA